MLHLENMKVKDGRNQTMMTHFLKLLMQHKGCIFSLSFKDKFFKPILLKIALSSSSLKVSTNEKRGMLKVIAFDRSFFKGTVA